MNPESASERLIGWKGETYDPKVVWSENVHQEHPGPGLKGKFTPDAVQAVRPHAIHLSWKPRSWLFKSFLSPEECDHLIALAEPAVQRSTVVDAQTGGGAVNNIRTSHGMFLPRGYDSVMKSIEERIAMATLLPVNHGEDLQILRYQPGQKYDAHWDYFEDSTPGAKERFLKDGNRVATFLMYLADTEEGGETVFPHSEWADGAAPDSLDGYSPCATKGVAAKARKGDAILFWDTAVDGKVLDRHSMHAACPVIKGVKWSAAKWIHSKPFRVQPVPSEAERNACEDRDPSCADWASKGECTKNHWFMVGDLFAPGACKKSCNACGKDVGKGTVEVEHEEMRH